MSAQIPETMLLSELLKPTGYDCPEELQGKTFAEATTGGDAKISTNTAKTIDVSAYTEPVEVEPAEGYDATKKVTVTLSNIPSGGPVTLYAWDNDGAVDYYDFDIAPADQTAYDNSKNVYISNGTEIVCETPTGNRYTRISDTEWQYQIDAYPVQTLTRNSSKDVTLW
jgi:hypothetical protein